MAAVVNVVPASLIEEGDTLPGGWHVRATAPALSPDRVWLSVECDGERMEPELPARWPVPVVVEAVDR